MSVDRETLADLIRRGKNHQLTSQMSTDASLTAALEELQERRDEDVEAIAARPHGVQIPEDDPGILPSGVGSISSGDPGGLVAPDDSVAGSPFQGGESGGAGASTTWDPSIEGPDTTTDAFNEGQNEGAGSTEPDTDEEPTSEQANEGESESDQPEASSDAEDSGETSGSEDTQTADVSTDSL